MPDHRADLEKLWEEALSAGPRAAARGSSAAVEKDHSMTRCNHTLRRGTGQRRLVHSNRQRPPAASAWSTAGFSGSASDRIRRSALAISNVVEIDKVCDLLVGAG